MNESRLLRFSTTIFDFTKYALIIVVIAVAIVILLGTPLLVKGDSMLPNFRSGEVVIIERISFSGDKTIKRGDVVAAKFPADPQGTRLIKRVVGLPGETISSKEGQIFVNGLALQEPYQPRLGQAPAGDGEPVTLKSDQYYLAGDNRPGSSDSRLWGPVSKPDIVGRVSFAVFPFGTARYIDRPEYGD